jgi:hypothetical protein
MFAAIRAFIHKATSPPPTAQRSYDAAAGGRRWRGAGETPSLQSAAHAGRESTARRTRDATINNGLAASALSVTVSESVGSGLRPARRPAMRP